MNPVHYKPVTQATKRQPFMSYIALSDDKLFSSRQMVELGMKEKPYRLNLRHASKNGQALAN